MAPNQTRNGPERRSTDRRSQSAEYDALAARLDAVERAVTDGDAPNSPDSDSSSRTGGDGGPTAVRDGDADPTDRDAEIEALRERVATLEAELDAVRGLLDGARAVDEAVERKADAALAAVERLESAAADDEALVVERVPADELSAGADAGMEAANPDTGGRGADAEREADGERSLAARLRGAL